MNTTINQNNRDQFFKSLKETKTNIFKRTILIVSIFLLSFNGISQCTNSVSIPTNGTNTGLWQSTSPYSIVSPPTGFINQTQWIGNTGNKTYRLPFWVTKAGTFNFRFQANADNSMLIKVDGITTVCNIPATTSNSFFYYKSDSGSVNLNCGNHFLEATILDNGGDYGGFIVGPASTISSLDGCLSLTRMNDCFTCCDEIQKWNIQGPTKIECGKKFELCLPFCDKSVYSWKSNPNSKFQLGARKNCITVNENLPTGSYTFEVKVSCDGKTIVKSHTVNIVGKCCPPHPLGKNTLAPFIMPVMGSTLGSNYGLNFQYTAAICNQMQTYIDNYNTVFPTCNKIVSQIMLESCGSGSSAVTPGTKLSDKWQVWTAGTTTVCDIHTSAMPGTLAPNTWYKIITWLYFEPSGCDKLPTECRGADQIFRIVVPSGEMSIAKSASSPKVKLEFSDGTRITNTIELK